MRSITCVVLCLTVMTAGLWAQDREDGLDEGPGGAIRGQTEEERNAHDAIEQYLDQAPVPKRGPDGVARRMPFIAVCEPIQTRSYRHSTNIRGARQEPRWSRSEGQNQVRVFKLISKRYLRVDERPARVMAEFPDGIIFGTRVTSGIEATVELFIWNRKLGTLVGTSANGHSSGKMTGSKIVSAKFDCDFRETQ